MKDFSENELYSILSQKSFENSNDSLENITNVMESLSKLCESIFMNYIGDALIKETNGKINIPKRGLPDEIAKAFSLLIKITIMYGYESKVKKSFKELMLSYRKDDYEN